MKYLTEVTVPSYSIQFDNSLLKEVVCAGNPMEARFDVNIPESQQTVEIDLNDIDNDELVKYIEANNCKVIALDDYIEYERVTNLYSELEECFEKHTLNKIQRADIINKIIMMIEYGNKR